ncbi:MAG: hypothetical protein EKK41_04000 [Hyphomicrobiales bacterium]|nr:MAG: hypothetical protein EKK41_04000 [Hyphomicrobiales bacterium]
MSKTLFSKTVIALATAAFAATASVGTIAYAQEKKTTTPPKATASKTPSACKGLAEAACKDKSTECTWVSASKGKDGKDKKAYCRAKPKAKSK